MYGFKFSSCSSGGMYIEVSYKNTSSLSFNAFGSPFNTSSFIISPKDFKFIKIGILSKIISVSICLEKKPSPK